ncbi:hypothetical protein CWI36_0045p0080 [Hamiltosporidium magnivora]|uniref:Uncharacterized protein n=1 Tax=Hamiltosporidium magnivora TaxID=148818 RepID=A0A4Q9LP29_9MICR|nr:hypothetical protein CWI36_1832p0020 [Hamiltosporidium magnivora]TBU09261.1 hypothetical protein CWI36_0045p0080 [Hamiltosporidium magnivora]
MSSVQNKLEFLEVLNHTKSDLQGVYIYPLSKKIFRCYIFIRTGIFHGNGYCFTITKSNTEWILGGSSVIEQIKEYIKDGDVGESSKDGSSVNGGHTTYSDNTLISTFTTSNTPPTINANNPSVLYFPTSLTLYTLLLKIRSILYVTTPLSPIITSIPSENFRKAILSKLNSFIENKSKSCLKYYVRNEINK